jgi:hypothetical protein
LIVGCLAASAAVSAGSSLAEGDTPGMRLLVGTAFAGVGLATVSMFSPDLAAGFAVLVLTATVFNHGGPFLGAVTNLTTGTTQRTGTRRRRTTSTRNGVAV